MVQLKDSRNPPLEEAEEKEFLRELKKMRLPVKTRKMNGLGFRDWPDRLIIGPKKFFMWIEFKRKILGKLSPGQAGLFKDMEEMDHEVLIFNDGKEAALAVKAALIAHGVTL